jgi:hypothetical protein
VNQFPEINALGTGKEREVGALVPTPGKRLLLTLPKSPVRAVWRASNEDVFAVGGDKLYQISSSWVATELGTLTTDSGAVCFADNGTHVFLVDGTNGYTWNLSTDTFAQVSDPDFYAADTVAYIDGYFVFNRTGTGQYFHSDLNAVTFDPLDIGTAEGSSDNLIGVLASNQNVYMFGTQSTEVYYNSGDADSPFVRMSGAVNDVGCYAVHSIAKLHGVPYFLGGDSTGRGIIYRMKGYQAERISTPSVESVIRGLDQDDLANARAWVYQQGGHSFYCLNLPGADSTWVFDVSTEMWHERQWLNLWSRERDRADCHSIAFGENIVGDYQNGKIYALDPDYYTDDTNPIPRIRTAPHISKNLKLVRHNSFQLDMETGVGDGSLTQGADPKVMLRWSDDGGHSWSNEYWADAGKIGNRKARVIWRRLGMSRDRVYEVTITDPVKVVLIGAEIDLEEGVA